MENRSAADPDRARPRPAIHDCLDAPIPGGGPPAGLACLHVAWNDLGLVRFASGIGLSATAWSGLAVGGVFRRIRRFGPPHADRSRTGWRRHHRRGGADHHRRAIGDRPGCRATRTRHFVSIAARVGRIDDRPAHGSARRPHDRPSVHRRDCRADECPVAGSGCDHRRSGRRLGGEPARHDGPAGGAAGAPWRFLRHGEPPVLLRRPGVDRGAHPPRRSLPPQ